MRRGLLTLVLVAASAFAETPRIDSISPPRGPIAGGTIVTITGANLAPAAVTLDGAAVTPVSHTASQVQLQMPAHDNGYALLQVGSAAAEYLYVPPRLQDLPPGYITTVAGVGKYVRLGLPATQSMLVPWDLTIAAEGDIYFMQSDRGLLLRIDSDGVLHHVAGTLGAWDWEYIGDDQPATKATFGFARSVAIDGSRNAYITDVRARVRKVDAATGVVTTVAGTGVLGHSGDGGPATLAQIGEPTYIASAPDGTLYFLEALPVHGGFARYSVYVRKVATDGIISTVAGNGAIGETGDGGPAVDAALNVGLNDFGDIAIDARQNVFVLEKDGSRVRRVDAQTGVITTFVSLAFPPGDNRQIGPSSIATDAAGHLWVWTTWNVQEFDAAGHLLGKFGDAHGSNEDGVSLAHLYPGASQGLAIAANGDIVVSDVNASRLKTIPAATGIVKTIAGMAPDVIGVPGDPLGAVFSSPAGDLAFLPSGDLLYADASGLRIFRLNLAGHTIVPFAGTGLFSGTYEGGKALDTAIYCLSLATSSTGVVYATDKMTIRTFEPDGTVRRFAGQGLPFPQYGFAGDGGPARDAILCQPFDIDLDSHENLYIADTNNNRIRRVDATTGTITTVAGSGESNGFEGFGRGTFCGDGNPALSACFNSPIGVAVLDDGSMYVDDFYNNPNLLRKIAPDGTVSTIASPLTFRVISGLGGSVIAHGGTRLFRLEHDRARTIAGTGVAGFSGDGGPATKAQIATGEAELVHGIIIDREGNLFFQDGGNRRIRAVRYGAVTAPVDATIEATKSGSNVTVTVRDSEGQTVPGVRVDFSAPASGATCTLSNPFAITDENGRASVTCTRNCLAGSYLVTAQPLTASSVASVSFTNASGPCRRRPVRRSSTNR